MYACQIIAGIALSYTFKLTDSTGGVDIQIIGLLSVLISGIMVLLLFWWDIRRCGTSFYPQIGLQPSIIKNSKAILLVIAVLVTTHFLAWLYRSVILPIYDQGGIIGGGSQMFRYIQENGGRLEMSGFLILALIVGPVMEEVVFRGYLQSSLAKRFPAWGAIAITSLVFMAGHSPMVLWPMYFMFSFAWGWSYLRTGSLKMAILLHVLSNLFYTVVGFAGWNILA
jgi:membrane protease YdiL (CAAX protease family)